MIVADTVLAVYAATPGPNRQLASAVLRKDSEWAAPFLWRSEFRNAMFGMVRNGLLSSEEGVEAFRHVSAILAGREHQVDTAHIFRLAEGNRITAYDLEFVALAQSLGVPLVTFDREVLTAFPAIAVRPEVFAG
ncbi:MAG: type II toxin-antitoxin system VapC family toxin [Dehalococcoidia bacterium]